MQIKIFTIPVLSGEKSLLEMNAFLKNNKVLSIDKELLSDKNGSYWTFCITYLEKQTMGISTSKKRKKVDYRQELDEATFTRFSQLREIRKTIAQEEAVPAYAIFTDEELAGVAKLEMINEKTLLKVKGVGEKKVSKYGRKVSDLWVQKQKDHEKKRLPDTRNSDAE